jgi:streptomycin 6-kinase
VASIPIPDNLAADIAGDDKHAERRAWLAHLPATVADLSERWALQVGDPYSPGGSCSWVAPARLGGAREGLGQAPDAVLKIAWVHDEALHEADGLRTWNGAGAVRLLAECRLGPTHALLLERCVPGTALAELKTEYSQDEIVAGLLQRLWIEPAAGASRPEADGRGNVEASGDTRSWRPIGGAFRALEEMCDRWADGFEGAWERSASEPGARGVRDPGLAWEGAALFRELPRTSARRVLLCTDLHAGNVLAAEREPWLVIDPKPYVGDPAYDVLQHMLNCPGRLHADPCGLARRMAQLCGLDTERVEAWLLARSVIESIESPELSHVARKLSSGLGRVARP